MPFEIPEEILKSWKKIGEKGEDLELKWKKNLNKKSKEIKTSIENFKSITDYKILEELIKKEKTK